MTNMEEYLFAKYLEQIIMEEGMQVPAFLPERVECVTVKDMSSLMSALLASRDKKYTLVLTRTKAVFDMLAALNPNCTDHHIAGYFEGNAEPWMYQDLLEEFSRIENTRFDPDGTPHIVKAFLGEQIYLTEDDKIVLKTPSGDWPLPANKPLYMDKEQTELFGYLITDPDFSGSLCLGHLSGAELTAAQRAALAGDLFAHMTDQQEICLPQLDALLVFSSGRGLAYSYEIPGDPDAAIHTFCAQLLFDCKPGEQADLSAYVCSRLAGSYELIPSRLLGAIETAYLLGKPLSYQKWRLLFLLSYLEMSENCD